MSTQPAHLEVVPPDVQRAGIYNRLSCGVDTSRQEDDNLAFCARKGWPVVETYTDHNLSASRRNKKGRAAFAQMLADARTGKIDAIVVWRTDRATRRGLKEMGEIIEAAREGGGRVVSATEGIDSTTAAGRIVFAVLAEMAEGESDATSQRVARKHEQLAKEGKPVGGGNRPFGFAADRVTHVEHEAAVIRDLAARYLKGDSLTSLARLLSAEGIPTSTGKPEWSPQIIRSMLSAPRTAGLRVHRGEEFTAVWKPILDRATWDAVARRLNQRAGVPMGSAPRKWLFRGLMVCGLCGMRMTFGTVDRGRYPTWRCQSGPGRSGCGKVTVLVNPSEELLVSWVVEVLKSPPLVKALERRRGDDPALAELVKLKQREDEIAELAALGADEGGLSPAQVRVANKALRVRLEAAEARARRSEEARALDGVVGTDGIAVLWKSLSFDRQRAILHALLHEVRVLPATRFGPKLDPNRLDPIWRL